MSNYPTLIHQLAEALQGALVDDLLQYQSTEWIAKTRKAQHDAQLYLGERAAQEQAASAAPAGDDDRCLKMMCLVEDYMAAVDWHGSQNGEKCDAAIEAIGQYLRKIATPPAPTAQPLTDAAMLDFVLDRSAFICTIPGPNGDAYQLMEQDEDEDYQVISGEGIMYRTKREAVEVAMQNLAGDTPAEGT